MLSPVTNQLPPVMTGFPIWDFHEPVYSIPGSHEPKPDRLKTVRPRLSVEERRRRRKISNRESARRLRARRQKHLGDLGCQLDLLRAENRESKDLLRLAVGRHQLIRRENERLMSEAAVLRRRLADMTGILRFQQLGPQFNTLLCAWPCSGENSNGFACFNDEVLAVNSLIA